MVELRRKYKNKSVVTWKASTSGKKKKPATTKKETSYSKQMAILNILGNERGVQLCFRISSYNIKAKFCLIIPHNFLENL